MGVTKSNTIAGDGVTKAKQGDTITMEYTGYLQDTSKSDQKGKQSVFTSRLAMTVERELSLAMRNHELTRAPVGISSIKQVRQLRRQVRLQHQDRCRPGHQG
jgi:hypothetical protein